MRYYGKMSYQKISEVLGISETAVHGRLTRAKKQIEKMLRRKGIAGLNNEALCK
jgi:DNA-directed RNA polymerase specialized sigma24 family protein